MAKVTKTNKAASANLASNKRKRTMNHIVNLRDRDEMSWAAIAEAKDMSPKSVRRLYDEAKGAGAHFESRPLAGGRPAPVKEQEQAEA